MSKSLTIRREFVVVVRGRSARSFREVAVLASFRREVPDDIVVSIDGVMDLDPDISARPASRVLIELPDYAADALAHLLADACAVAEVFGGFPNNGLDGRALAEALYAAATSGAYRCHEGGLAARPLAS